MSAANDFAAVFSFLDRVTPNRVECSWCNAVMSPGREPVSHGICQPCALQHFGIDLAQAQTQEDACRR